MQKFSLAAMALAAALVIPNMAFADDVRDRTEAIQLCRAEIASQAGVDASQVRLDQVRVRGRSIRVDLDVWRDGSLQNVRCDVNRAAELTIAAITPALQTASVE